MSEMNGNQAIGCNVSSCKHFNDSKCTLSNIQVGACTNASTGIAEDETLCMSYERREDKSDGKSLDNMVFSPILPI
ncbi:MAG: DUF1540 domain-containing protein [Syntrophomonas sp.]|nr:DUF1540 domain-containing protein [Syntrophomonas sp.]